MNLLIRRRVTALQPSIILPKVMTSLVAFKSGTDVFAPKQKENNVRYIIMNYFREMKAQGKVVESKIEGRCVVE